jgi:type IV pilus assembly protein PilM
MPKIPEAALRKSIRFEAGRYVPSSIEESLVEFEILGTSSMDSETGEEQMDVLLVASPRDMVESKISAANAAGLEVEVVDVEAFALYRTLVECDDFSDAENRVVAFVDIGGQNTHVSVVDHGSFVLTRSIPIGGNGLTEALKNYFKMSTEDAETGKRSLNLATLINGDQQPENPPLRVVQPLIDELVREIRRSLNYYQSQQSEQGLSGHVSELILSGGGSLLEGLPAYFGHKLNVSVSAPSPFDNPRFLYDGFEPPADARSLAVAMGLALRGEGKAQAAA